MQLVIAIVHDVRSGLLLRLGTLLFELQVRVARRLELREEVLRASLEELVHVHFEFVYYFVFF